MEGTHMTNSRGMTVATLLEKVSTFPPHGAAQVKVGKRWYPRSTSDDVPEIVRAAANEIKHNPNRFDLDLKSSYPDMLTVTLGLLLDMVWPGRQNSDTMHKNAARYVVDWSNENGFDLAMPEAAKERPV